MPNVVDTKARLSSAKSTQKVIKAMELVASSKIKRAREKAQNIRFFYDTTMELVNNVFSYSEILNSISNPDGHDLVFVISSDMGLCGSYNANIYKKVFEVLNDDKDAEIIAMGNKIIGKLSFENYEPIMKINQYSSRNEVDIANEVTSVIKERLETGQIRNVKIIYTKFINALVQEVEVLDLFSKTQLNISEEGARPELLIEPDKDTILSQFIEQYIISLVYTAIIQSLASEHSYRRNAMESANKNSLELIDKLNLELNRIRQAMITQEISEIIGGSEALEKG